MTLTVGHGRLSVMARRVRAIATSRAATDGPDTVQPGTWVTLWTGHMGNTTRWIVTMSRPLKRDASPRFLARLKGPFPRPRPDIPRVLRPAAVKEAQQAPPQAGQSLLCAGHVRQSGGESPLCNLMEVKHE